MGFDERLCLNERFGGNHSAASTAACESHCFFFFWLLILERERERYVRLRGVPVPEAEKIGRVV